VLSCRARRCTLSSLTQQGREPFGRVVLGHMMDVDHRRLDVGVAHERLHVEAPSPRCVLLVPNVWRRSWEADVRQASVRWRFYQVLER
jgi:hypothetical protein